MAGLSAQHLRHNYSAWAEIDLSALRHNVNLAQSLAPNSQLMAMVKANAYGHGLEECAGAIEQHVGALAVARLDEALSLRQAGIKSPLVLMSTHWTDDLLQAALAHELQLVIGARQQLDMLDVFLKTSSPAKPFSIWLKHDSGMHRMGLNDRDFQIAIDTFSKHKAIEPLRLMTHLATADELNDPMTASQIQRFDRYSQGATEAIQTSIANSAAVIRYPQAHRDWVRPGIMLYGCDPRDVELLKTQPLNLQAVMSLYARVLRVQQIEAGESVGYGATWRADKSSLIATLGIGYGDGYPRQLGNGTPVQFAGGIAPLAGRVSMDLISVDVTGLAQPPQAGDIACLWGQSIKAETIADRASTIPYHLLTGVTARVPRFFRNK